MNAVMLKSASKEVLVKKVNIKRAASLVRRLPLWKSYFMASQG